MVIHALGTVGGFRLLGEIGRGSFGAVYRARDERTGDVVALKLLARADDGGRSLERFRREGQLLTRVPPHPNLVGVKAVGEHSGLPYIAMELVEGRTLEQILKTGSRPTPLQAGRLVERLARALDHLHGAGVLHRDLNARNIIVDPRGEPRLVDFGLALDLLRTTRLTQTGEAVGAAAALAPENLFAPDEVGPATDVYAAGALLYQLLAGEPLWSHVSGHEELVEALRDEKPNFALMRPDTPLELARVLEIALAKRPADRWKSGALLADAIDAALGGRAALPGTVPDPPSGPGLPPPSGSALFRSGPASGPGFPAVAPAAAVPPDDSVRILAGRGTPPVGALEALEPREAAFARALEASGLVRPGELARLVPMLEALRRAGKPETLSSLVVRRNLAPQDAVATIAGRCGLSAPAPPEPVRPATSVDDVLATNEGSSPGLTPEPATKPGAASGTRGAFKTEPLKPGDVDSRPVPPPKTAVHLAEGSEVGPYRIVKTLGTGGMGIVYEAQDPTLGRPVALKVMRSSASRAQLERFRREARAAAKLRHPNVVAVYGFGEADGLLYYAMDLVRGRGLDALVKADARPEVRESARLVAKIARGLHAAHELGIVHRDVKPANILLADSDGEPRIADFGVAFLAEDEDEESVRLTREGAALGTPVYMPPEQALGDLKKIGPASDVYSLGVTLYELATGDVPFRARTAQELFYMIASQVPPTLRSRRPEVPAELDAIVLKALEKDPRDRYPSALALALDLEAFAAGETVQARSVGTLRRLARRAVRSRAARIGALPLVVAVALSGRLLALESRASDLAERGHELELRARRVLDEGKPFRDALAAGLDAESYRRWDEALDAFEKAAAARPTSLAARAGRARCLLEAARLDEASTALAELAPRIATAADLPDPERAATWVSLAHLALLRDLARLPADREAGGETPLARALDAAEHARAASPLPGSVAALARAYLAAARPQDAATLAGSLEGDAAAAPGVAADLALAALARDLATRAGDRDELTTRALAATHAAGDPVLQATAAWLVLQGDDAKGARDAFDELARTFPRCGLFLVGLARACADSGDFDAAQTKLLEAAQARDPATDTGLQVRIARALGMNGIEPVDGRGFYDRALVLLGRQDITAALRAARAAFEKCVAGAPGTPPLSPLRALLFVAQVNATVGDLDGALAAIDDGLKQDPRSLVFLKLRLDILLKRSRWAEALETLDALRPLGYVPPPQSITRADLLLQLGRFEEAVTEARALARATPRDISAHTTLVHALAESGDYEGAVAAARAAEEAHAEPNEWFRREADRAERLALPVASPSLADEQRSAVASSELGDDASAWKLTLDPQARGSGALAGDAERGARRHLFGQRSYRITYAAQARVAAAAELKLDPPLDVSSKRELVAWTLLENGAGTGLPRCDLFWLLVDANGNKAAWGSKATPRPFAREGWTALRLPLRGAASGEWLSRREPGFDETKVVAVRCVFQLEGDEPRMYLWLDGVHFE